MRVGMGEARAIELEPRESVQPVIGRIEAWMLAGEDDQAIEPALVERGGDWRELDGFGPGADDEPDFSVRQPSP